MMCDLIKGSAACLLPGQVRVRAIRLHSLIILLQKPRHVRLFLPPSISGEQPHSDALWGEGEGRHYVDGVGATALIGPPPPRLFTVFHIPASLRYGDITELRTTHSAAAAPKEEHPRPSASGPQLHGCAKPTAEPETASSLGYYYYYY